MGLQSLGFQAGGGVFRSKLWSSQIWSFSLGGGAFWFEIPEGAFWRIWTKNYCLRWTVQKPACASQIVSHILRMWRLMIHVCENITFPQREKIDEQNWFMWWTWEIYVRNYQVSVCWSHVRYRIYKWMTHRMRSKSESWTESSRFVYNPHSFTPFCCSCGDYNCVGGPVNQSYMNHWHCLRCHQLIQRWSVFDVTSLKLYVTSFTVWRYMFGTWYRFVMPNVGL